MMDALNEIAEKLLAKYGSDVRAADENSKPNTVEVKSVAPNSEVAVKNKTPNSEVSVKDKTPNSEITIKCTKPIKGIRNAVNAKPNRGHGAGGSNTNYFGKQFEQKTILPEISNSTLSTKDRDVLVLRQSAFKKYIKTTYAIELFRNPDEAYIIRRMKGKTIIKILEKKSQSVEGSVEIKLWSGPSLKREYELMMGNDFEVHYAYCVNDFLKRKLVSNNPKYITLNIILREHQIDVLFGDDDDYSNMLKKWILS